MMKKVLNLYKNIGETPLECINRFKSDNPEYKDMPMTYAGRLDPMAEGLLIILVGEECKKKDKYLGLDKEYEIEVLLGIETDSQDILGLVGKVDVDEPKKISLEKYVGKFNQEYPMFSSKTVRGKQLHEYARAGEVPEEMPTKDIEIYSIEKFEERKINGEDIATTAIKKIKLLKGDFRQNEIAEDWQAFAEEFSAIDFNILLLKVKCSSGTYMRTLAERMGKGAGVGAIAYSIKRLSVGAYRI